MKPTLWLVSIIWLIAGYMIGVSVAEDLISLHTRHGIMLLLQICLALMTAVVVTVTFAKQRKKNLTNSASE